MQWEAGMGAWKMALAALWVVVLGLVLLVVALLRQVGMLEVRLQELAQQRVSRVERRGLPPGSRAPELRLLDAQGAEVCFRPGQARRSVVVLSQPGCGPCEQVWPALGRLVQAADAPTVTVITKGSPGSVVAPAGVQVLYQRGAEAMRQFQAYATPWVFVVGPGGMIEAQGSASDDVGLHRLLAAASQAAATGHARQEVRL
jgi:hypothetical protein